MTSYSTHICPACFACETVCGPWALPFEHGVLGKGLVWKRGRGGGTGEGGWGGVCGSLFQYTCLR